jgi:cytidine deaminase
MAREYAYAPYSNYAVGAAVLDDAGRTYRGANVENALYGACMCAERVAIFAAIAAGARGIRALAVATPSGGAPCGFCRQVLLEFADSETPVMVAAPDGSVRTLTLAQLLPEPWGAADLH